MDTLVLFGTQAGIAVAVVAAYHYAVHWRGQPHFYHNQSTPETAPERHEHWFNRRDDQGVYTCACGARYLDGKPPKRRF